MLHLPAEREPALTLGTAGHVDHGKTTLIAALTGVDTDRLAEEKRRGISIELGFAELDLPSGRRLGVVDTPGHERLVRTMVAGATGVDLFLLAIAADDGVMPQTREHLAVLAALGVERGVIALTRSDLADAETRSLAAAEARELLPAAPLIEVSAPAGDGLAELREALDEVAALAAADRSSAPADPRPGLLHVDRSFSLRGVGTVVTGTVSGSGFEAGTSVTAQPAGRRARVRTIQVHGRGVERVGAGSRAALNLARVGVGEVERGDLLSADEGGRPLGSYRLDVALLAPEHGAGPLDRRLQVHHGTRDVAARAVALDGKDGGREATPARLPLLQLRLEAPLLATAGERVVLRRIAPVETIAGAVIVDPAARRHGPGPAAEHLRTLLEGTPEAILASALSLAAEDGLPAEPETWWARSDLGYGLCRFTGERWRQAIAALAEQSELLIEGELLLPPGAAAPAPVPEPTPRPLEAVERRALELLWSDGLEPRAPGPLAEALGIERSRAEAALGALVEAGELERIKPGVHYPPERLRRIEALVLALAGREGSVSLPELRDALGTSRKYSQAILEHLDRSALTVRHGDRHLPRLKQAGASR